MFKNAVGGLILRPIIQRWLGKDWWESLTVWGLVAYFAASGAVEAVCGDGLMMSAVFCTKATAAVEGIGKVLVILGIRRK